MDKLLQEMVRECREEGILSWRIGAIDTTALPTLF
jgi:hypothetical protein